MYVPTFYQSLRKFSAWIRIQPMSDGILVLNVENCKIKYDKKFCYLISLRKCR